MAFRATLYCQCDDAPAMAGDWALSELGKDATKALPALLDALEDPDARVAMCACDAIRAMAPEACSALPRLREIEGRAPRGVAAELRLTILALEKPNEYGRLAQEQQSKACLLLLALIVVAIALALVIILGLRFLLAS